MGINHLPPAISGNDNLNAMVQAFDATMTVPIQLLLPMLLDSCQSEALPSLAQNFDLLKEPIWQPSVETAQRETIKKAVPFHRAKGTPRAIGQALVLAGFGENYQLIEGMSGYDYDGTVFADGSATYADAAWAAFTVAIDLGETQGIDTQTIGRAIEFIEIAKPVSRYLRSIDFTASVQDEANIIETQSTQVAVSHASQRPWRTYFNGSQRYNHGELTIHNGKTTANGMRQYLGYAATDIAPISADDEQSITTIDVTHEDTQHISALCNGALLANGAADHGDIAPMASDIIMPIAVTHHQLFNGRKFYGSDNALTGQWRFDGARHYQSGITANGNITLQEYA